MDAKELIVEMMKSEGMTQRDLGAAMGYGSTGAVSAILLRKGLQVDLLCRMVKALGGEVVVRTRSGEEKVLG